MKMKENAEMENDEVVLFESRDGAVSLPVLADEFDTCVDESCEEWQ